MANLNGINIDPNVKEQAGAFTVLPKGKYAAVIVKDDLMDNKANTGKLLNIILQIIEGEFKGTEIIDRLNIINPSAQSQAIGQGQLKRICTITKQPFPPADTRKCWGIPLVIDVDIEEFQSNTTDKMLQSNKVKGYHEKTAAAQPSAGTPTNGSW